MHNLKDEYNIFIFDDQRVVTSAVGQWVSEDIRELLSLKLNSEIPKISTTHFHSFKALEAQIKNPEKYPCDLLITDAVVKGPKNKVYAGGLSALSSLKKHRPRTPAILLSSLEEDGSRFFHCLAAANWFRSVTKAIVPKAPFAGNGPQDSRALLREAVGNILLGKKYDCSFLERLQDTDSKLVLDNILPNPSDLLVWRTHIEFATANQVARRTKRSLRGLNIWRKNMRNELEGPWGAINGDEDIEMGGDASFFEADGNNDAARNFQLLRDFALIHQSFFRDSYLDSYFVEHEHDSTR